MLLGKGESHRVIVHPGSTFLIPFLLEKVNLVHMRPLGKKAHFWHMRANLRFATNTMPTCNTQWVANISTPAANCMAGGARSYSSRTPGHNIEWQYPAQEFVHCIKVVLNRRGTTFSDKC